MVDLASARVFCVDLGNGMCICGIYRQRISLADIAGLLLAFDIRGGLVVVGSGFFVIGVGCRGWRALGGSLGGCRVRVSGVRDFALLNLWGWFAVAGCVLGQ